MPENTEQNKNTNTEGLTTILLRNAFYRDNYKRAIFSVMIVFCVNVVLFFSILDHYFNPPEPQYFPMNAQFQLIKWHPLSDPVVSDNFVLQWTAQAVREAFSLDFIHWRSQLQRASNNFTPSGWHFFLQSFQQSGDLDTLVKLHMVANASITGSPVPQYQGVVDGRYVWKIAMPMLITYTNSSGKTINQPLKVTVVVMRVPVTDNPEQIAIDEFAPDVQAE